MTKCVTTARIHLFIIFSTFKVWQASYRRNTFQTRKDSGSAFTPTKLLYLASEYTRKINNFQLYFFVFSTFIASDSEFGKVFSVVCCLDSIIL